MTTTASRAKEESRPLTLAEFQGQWLDMTPPFVLFNIGLAFSIALTRKEQESDPMSTGK